MVNFANMSPDFCKYRELWQIVIVKIYEFRQSIAGGKQILTNNLGKKFDNFMKRSRILSKDLKNTYQILLEKYHEFRQSSVKK